METKQREVVTSERLLYHKWTTFIAMYVGYMLVILDRKSFSFALPAIIKDQQLDKDDLGLITSSQNLAYSISKFLGGVISDQVSSKLLFSAGLALAGVFTIAFTGFETAPAFAVLWFLQGFVQGGLWPACAKILRRWFSPSCFGTWYAILNTAMNVACCVGPILSIHISRNYGWRGSMTFFGLLSLLVALVAFPIMVDSPSDIGFESFADAKDSKGKPASRGRGTWRDMLYSPFMWVLCGSYMVVFMARTAALDWAQLYLIHEAGQSEFTGSGFISALETGGFVGTIVSGYTGDKLVAMSERRDTRGTPRMLVVIGNVLLCIVSLHCILFMVSQHSSQIWITVLGFALGFGLYGPIALYGVMAIEAAPTHLTGMSHAIVALSANIGAIIAGLPLSVVATYFNWKGAFVLLELLLVITVVIKVLTRKVEYKMITIKKKKVPTVQ